MELDYLYRYNPLLEGFRRVSHGVRAGDEVFMLTLLSKLNPVSKEVEEINFFAEVFSKNWGTEYVRGCTYFKRKPDVFKTILSKDAFKEAEIKLLTECLTKGSTIQSSVWLEKNYARFILLAKESHEKKVAA